MMSSKRRRGTSVKKTTSRKSGALWLGALVVAVTQGGIAQAGLVTGPLSAIASLCIAGSGASCEIADGVLTGGLASDSYDLTVNPDDGSFGFGDGVPDPIGFEGASLGFLDVDGNVDPLLSLGVTGIDPVGGTSFFAALVAPVVGFPDGAPFKSTCSVAGAFSNGASNNQVGADPFLSAPNLVGCTINGGTIATVGPPVPVTNVGGPGGILPYFDPLTGGAYTTQVSGICPPGGCVSFDLLLSLTNTGGAGDLFVLTATHNLVPVPAPPAIALLGLGLLALATPRLRRNRNGTGPF
jgi:hypothetical protein